ncbi:GH92 family glycosyl hydrolase [Luteolibacter pohnpeiensis]|uniref:GH92 family glycosyl hydrolase n=1 Tax=Luteolibacter pohnpeiensis TaxID=454153 RepID=A0A934VWJ2_9BACT|nr:GH92 family glycosyl hydrolase [Luteolibacter pohnpeiensis]MBK1883340.1 GH92 family glycosyl hydrolase [Luteolibacter pohnpeiensis]
MKFVVSAALASRVSVAVILGCSVFGMSPVTAQDLSTVVNRGMGTTGTGNVSIGPQLPWASINPGPETPDGYSDGYHAEKKIIGFSQLHVTGTGSFGKYGQFLVTPQIGIKNPNAHPGSEKSDEVAGIGSYQVRLKDPGILCKVSPTEHSAIYQFTYPESDESSLLIDLSYSIPGTIFNAGYMDEGEVFVDPKSHTIRGWGSYWGGWSAEAVRVYFCAEYSRDAEVVGTWKNKKGGEGELSKKCENKDDKIGAWLKFKTKDQETIGLKLAVSFTSMDRAAEFLKAEIPDWDFEKVKSAAESAWRDKLGQVRLEGGTEDERTMFYTTLFNTMRMPKNRTGDNPHWQSDQPYWDDHYCVWDSWKTTFPLHLLLHESMVRDNLKAFIDRYKHNGRVMDAFVGGNDRFYKWTGKDAPEWLGNQGGDDVDNIFADACVKGVEGIDWKEAYEFLKFNADQQRTPSYRVDDRGWVPFREFEFGLYCSRSIEFAYNDFCVSEVAAKFRQTEDAKRYAKRSSGWENLWNPDEESDGFKGFLAPRWHDGTWLKFDPKNSRSEPSYGVTDRSFYQGSSWVYSYFIPHDFARLIELSGGKEAYVKRLEHALDKKLIDFSNEPSFLTPFSFIYAGRPDLASKWVRSNFKNYTMTSYPGDEDGGAMSSWYVFASLGLFPNAGQDVYLLNGPRFPKATLTRENGAKIVIEGVDASPENIYVQSLTVNGKPWDKAWLRHEDIKNGATLRFVMGPEPSDWGTKNPPPSVSQPAN